MTRRVQPRLFGGADVSYPGGKRGFQPQLPGIAEAAADAARLDLAASVGQSLDTWAGRATGGPSPEGCDDGTASE